MDKTEKWSGISNIFIAFFIVMTVIAVGVIYWRWQDISRDTYKEVAGTARLIERYYELSFEQWELMLMGVGNRINEMQAGEDYSVRREYALDALKTYEDLLALGMVAPSGQIILSTSIPEGEPLPNIMDNPKAVRSFLQSLDKNRISLGEPYFFENVKDWILPIRFTIRDENNEAVNVVTSGIAFRSLLQELAEFGFNDYFRMHIVNDDFNSTQIYFPIDTAQYDNIIRNDSDLYKEYELIFASRGLEYFEAIHTLTNKPVVGIKTELNELDHTLYLMKDKAVVMSEFYLTAIQIGITYFIIGGVFMFLFISFRRKERTFIKDLKEERDYTKIITDNSPNIIVGLDKESNIIYANPTVTKLTGFKQDEIKGKYYGDVFFDGFHDPALLKLRRKFYRKGLKNHEVYFNTKSGEKRLFCLQTGSFESDNTFELLVFGQDLSQRERAEKLLSEREANLKAIFESTTSIIGLFDRNKVLIAFNQPFFQYAKDIYNIEVEENASVFDLLEPARSRYFNKYMDEALKGNKVINTVDYEKDGKKYYFLFSYHPVIEDQNVIGVSLFVQDITELQEAQQKLKEYARNLEDMVEKRTDQLNKRNTELYHKNNDLAEVIASLQETQQQLVQAEKMASLGILSAGIAHEINNPLNFIKNGVMSMVKMIEDRDSSLARDMDPYIEIIKDGVTRAAKITKSLSHFSRKGVSYNDLCDLQEIIDNCLTILHNQVKNIEVEQIVEDENAVVEGSESKLHQVFINIIGNAVYALEGEGKITIKLYKEDGFVCVSIKDTGVGISEENLLKISDPFFTTKPPGKGTGLGLFITYMIIEEHNGKISVSSISNKGTEFIVKLPIELKK